MRHFILTLALCALAALPVAAQEPGAASDAAGVEAASAQTTDVAAEGATIDAPTQPTSSGLPPFAPPPRTLRAYWHVFAAFAVAWGLLFGYAILLARRSGALEEQLKRLEGSGA